MRSKEVEIKVQLDQQTAEKVRETLQHLADTIVQRHEEDIYYTVSKRDFLETNECLRIRETEEYTELTYKGPTTQTMKEKDQFWKEEIDIPVEKSDARALLAALDCKELVTVKKDREIFHVDGLEATLDRVKHAGWFLEVESTATTQTEVDDALKQNQQLLEKIGAADSPIVTQPYRDIVLENGD